MVKLTISRFRFFEISEPVTQFISKPLPQLRSNFYPSSVVMLLSS